MTVTEKSEREQMLSDTVLLAVLRLEADALGISAEEYVDKFLDAFYNAPQKFYDLLK